jgi:hypothetical protein
MDRISSKSLLLQIRSGNCGLLRILSARVEEFKKELDNSC